MPAAPTGGQLSVFDEPGFSMGDVEAWALDQGYARLVGVDEVGRGPLAGPVVAGAVVLDLERARSEGWLGRLRDSKELEAAERDELFDVIRGGALNYGVGQAEAWEIDEINILQATYLAMRRALEQVLPAYQRTPLLLVDGNRPIPGLDNQRTFIKGDGRSYHIAAASILAKVTRDRILQRLHERWPDYGFDRHKGYPTPAHRTRLAALGPCSVHRLSFKSKPPAE